MWKKKEGSNRGRVNESRLDMLLRAMANVTAGRGEEDVVGSDPIGIELQAKRFTRPARSRLEAKI